MGEPRAGRDRAWSAVAIATFFLVAIGLTVRLATLINIPGRPDTVRYGLIDFRNQIYYPTLAMLQGLNPYDPQPFLRAYPVDTVFAPYTPLSLVIHLPFGLMSLQASETIYTVMDLGFVLALAGLAWGAVRREATAARVFGLGALVLLSRPGHWNFILGQFAAELTAAAYVALRCADRRPWLSGLALAVTTFKPSFGAPLAILMTARRDYRAVAWGVGFGAALQGIGLAAVVHAAGGVTPFVASIGRGVAAWGRDSTVNPARSAFRIDAVGFVGHLLGTSPGPAIAASISLIVIVLGALAVRRLADREPAGDRRVLSASLACLVTVVCTYHLAYDTILLTLPLLTLLVPEGPATWRIGPAMRWTLAALLLVPAINFLSSGTALDALDVTGRAWTVATSINSGALLLSLLLILGLSFRRLA